ncbi:MAG: hypothetical protein HY748_04255 [Elusimicrobia bacterium]|nr:hypothetical protein [Elusimicrobiota bacterium]
MRSLLLRSLLCGLCAAVPPAVCPAQGRSPSGLDFAAPAKRLVKECRNAISRSESALAAVLSVSEGSPDFTNTPEAVENTLADCREATAALSFLRFVSTTSAVRDAALACDRALRQFEERTFSRADLHAAVLRYTDLKAPLAGEPELLVETQLKDFKAGGAALRPGDRESLTRLRTQIADLETSFMENIAAADAADHLDVSTDELAGLPAEFLEGLPAEQGRRRVGVSLDQYSPVMTLARAPSTRRFLATLRESRAKENLPVLDRLLTLRREEAGLLGYPSFSHLMLEGRMLGNPLAVEWFLDRLASGLEPLARRQLESMADLKAADERASSGRDRVIQAWDRLYYERRLRESCCGLDEERLREFLPVRAFVEGALSLAGRLYALRLREVSPAGAWHPAARLYEVSDAPDQNGRPGAVLGFLYTDLHRRPGKQPGISARSLVRPRRLAEGLRRPAVAALLADLPPDPGRRGFLSFDQADALLREFGKAIHLIVSRTRYARFASAETSWDFSEVPGLVFERWAWSESGLPLVSKHYRDGAPIPADLGRRLADSRRATAALDTLRQAAAAELDRRLHTAKVPDIGKEHARLSAEIGLIPAMPGAFPVASLAPLAEEGGRHFAHLWAWAVAEDLFASFDAGAGPDPSLARQFREAVLEPGATIPPADLVRRFLDRPASENALFEFLGAKAAKKR